MYDTLTLAWYPTGNEQSAFSKSGIKLDERLPWQSVRHDSVNNSLRAICNKERVQYTRLVNVAKKQNEYRVQCSLPKLLYGTNSRDLAPGDEWEALKLLAHCIGSDFGSVPAVEGMTVRRLDATADRLLGSEAAVYAALQRLRLAQIHGKSPIVTQSKGVSWPGSSGGFTRKAYGKYRESGELAAEGRLRVEVGAIGQKAVKAAYAKAVAAAAASGDLTVGTAFNAPGLSTAILGAFEGIVEVACEEVAEMKPLEFHDRLKATGLKPIRRHQLLGVAMMAKAVGWDAMEMSRRGKWQAKKEMEAAGVSVEQLELEPFDLKLSAVGYDMAVKVAKRGRKKKDVAAAPAGVPSMEMS